MIEAVALNLELGVKSDPIEYRFSYEWLFDLMAEENVNNLQLGTFFEIYQLPDEFFLDLRNKADQRGIRIRSVFTSHRELGGFFRFDGQGFDQVARRNFERLIEIGALVGAESVGCNPGAVLRDRMNEKEQGSNRYLAHMKELMHFARENGVGCLTMEPMSCLAEPPTLPTEIHRFAQELQRYHEEHRDDTSPAGYCADVSHGYADAFGKVVNSNFGLLEAGLHWTRELHLRNTDALYSSTIGFTDEDMERGVVDPNAVRCFLIDHQSELPTESLVGYLEVPGPKLGRDYSDRLLGESLRGSLQNLKQTWLAQETPPVRPVPVKLAPSIMCADLGNLASEARKLEAVGVDMIHVDIMDARFVPNMPLGIGVVKHLRDLTQLPLDVHLMVQDNEFFIRQFAEIGVERISIHVETATHLNRLLRLIRSEGIQAGAALCPATSPKALDYALEELDFVLLMTVDPGFAGQPMVKGAIAKIADTRRYLGERHISIEVDGNVSFENIPAMVAAGASELVLGSSSLFHTSGSLKANRQKVLEAVREGMKK